MNIKKLVVLTCVAWMGTVTFAYSFIVHPKLSF